MEILIFTAKIWDLKIYDVYRIGTGTEGEFFWWYWNWYRKKLVTEKSLGTGIGKIWYRKKVPEPVSEKFGTGKSTGIGIVNIWYRYLVSVSVSLKILGTVKLCPPRIITLRIPKVHL